MQALMIGVVVLVVGIIAGDIVYWQVTQRRLAKWEQGIERDSDGVRRGCRDFAVGDGDVALLLVHGFGDSPAIYSRMARALADRGFFCRAMRLPGFAKPMSEYAKTSMEQWVKAVEGELAELRRTHDRVWIVGHSLGGALSIHCALNRPDAVDGVILLAPLIKVSSRRSPALTPRTWHRIGGTLLTFTDVLENRFPLDVHDPTCKAADMRDRFVPRAVYEGLFRLIDANRGRASELCMPMQILLAGDDLIVDGEAAHAFWNELGSTRKQIHTFANAGHAFPIDTGWEKAVESMIDFIAPKQNDSVTR